MATTETVKTQGSAVENELSWWHCTKAAMLTLTDSAYSRHVAGRKLRKIVPAKLFPCFSRLSWQCQFFPPCHPAHATPVHLPRSRALPPVVALLAHDLCDLSILLVSFAKYTLSLMCLQSLCSSLPSLSYWRFSAHVFFDLYNSSRARALMA